MRILQVDKFLRRHGGAASYMLDVAAQQRARGHEVEFFSMQHPDNEPATYEDHFAPLATLEPLPAGLVPKAAGAVHFVWNRAAARRLDEVIDAFRPDVAHLHNVYHQLSPSVIWRLHARGVRVVLTAHDYKLVCPTYSMLDKGAPCTACLDGHFRHAVARRCKDGSLGRSSLMALETRVHRTIGSYRRVSTIIAPSRFMVDVLARAGITDGVRHVPHPAIPLPYEPPPPSSPTALYLGRLSAEKGIDLLLDAVERVPALTLRVTGDGPLREEVAARAARLGGQVELTGQLTRPEVEQELRASVATVLPSRFYENQPMSVLESMAAGRASVVSDLGGSPELVEHGRSGLVVPANDVGALAEALAVLAERPDDVAAMGRRARELAAERHDLDAHLDALEAIYAGG